MIESMYHRPLRSYWDMGSRIELHYYGSVVIYKDPEDLETLRRWSREAFRMYDRNQEEFNRNGVYQEDVRLDYINYMVRYGQYEENR